ncbi:MAG: MarR family transcriptional regulator [Terracidiphilus sp.]
MCEMHRGGAARTLPLLHAAKLTTTQLAAMEFVFDPRTISAVASHVGLSRPAASQMIHKLAGRGLIRRSESATDRREKTVVVTAKGNTLLEKISSARAARFAASISVLSPPVARRLKKALREAALQLEKTHKKSKRQTKAK